MTASHEDPDISDAWDAFGDSGIVIFWVFLEIYGREFNRTKHGKLTLSLRFFERKLRKKWKVIGKVLEFYQSRGRILFSKNEKHLTIHIPKFIEIASNWSRRQKELPTEVPTEVPTEAPTAIEVEVEEDKVPSASDDAADRESGIYLTKKKRMLKGQKLEWFLEFWKVFGYAKGKAEAADAWLDIQGFNNILFQSILKGAEQEASRRPDLLAQNKIPKMAQGWLSGKRWEDTYGPTSQGYKFR